MDRLRRIIIHKSDNGYMFSIKDLGHPYSDAAPVNKVAVNGPADCAGLRSGDGVVAINSNLVKGRTYVDLCSIIKSCRATSLELTVIENYCLTYMQPNKVGQTFEVNPITDWVQTHDNQQTTPENSASFFLENSSAQKYSPIVTKKKAYTCEKEYLERFSTACSTDSKPYNSAIDLCFDNNDLNLSNDDIANQISGRYRAAKAKISYKKATNSVYKATAKSDLDINNFGNVSSADSTNSSVISSKMVHYDPTKVVYHQAYNKQAAFKQTPNSISMADTKQQVESVHRNRRGSTPVISDSSSLPTTKGGRYSQTKMTPGKSIRKTSRNLSSTHTPNPVLQLNRVGGFVRAPLSVDETFDLDDECLEDMDLMLNSVDTATTDHSSATAATTESGRSSCDLDTMEMSSKTKFRHMHCSPMPYKSHNISNNSSKSLEITPTNELFLTQPPKCDSQTPNDALATSTPHPDHTISVINMPESPYHQTESYHDFSVDDTSLDKDELEYEHDSRPNHHTKHLKKLKNIFGDNYRCRSKTLDSDGKVKDDDVDIKVTPSLVYVKWITLDGKPCKSSWKQYLINVDDDRLIFCRERSQNYLKTISVDDATMGISLVNATVDDEPEKRGRKNTLRFIQAGKQHECLIEFLEKSVSSNWLRIISERSKPDKDEKESRTASFKERHSLTVPNLYAKDSNQSQFPKSKTKSKDESVSPSQSSGLSNPLSSTQTNKSVIHQAMSRVKNLKHKFASSGQVSDFERQQEEWFNKTGANSSTGKLVSSYSYSEDIQGGVDSVAGLGPAATVDCNEPGNSNSLPLHKWQRSYFSHLVPLVVELCVSIIETFGMSHVGLYRVSGNKVALDFISAELRKPLSDIDVSTDKWNDLHAISGVLKSFFRNLPDGLFPKDLYSDVIGACRMHEFDRERRLLSIQRFLSIMDIAQDHPEYRHHRETLRYLAEHLSRVACKQSTNRMTAKNLAVIFAPSLMKPPQETNQILVNDYRYKIQILKTFILLKSPHIVDLIFPNESIHIVLDFGGNFLGLLLMETLIKHHKWLFSPTLESACNIPSDSDDEEGPRNVFPSEDQNTDQPENVDYWAHEVTDARPLVKTVLIRATKIPNDTTNNLDSSTTLDNTEFDKNSSLTLAELSKQAYAFNSIDTGFNEVDIDEECEKRKGKAENNVFDKLKIETEQLLSECSSDLNELNGIEQQCHQDLSDVKLKITNVDTEITKVEHLLEKAKEKSSPQKSVASQLFEIPTKNLSSLSVALAAPLVGSQPPTSEPHKNKIMTPECRFFKFCNCLNRNSKCSHGRKKIEVSDKLIVLLS